MTVTLYYNYLIHDVDQWTFRLANMRVSDPLMKDSAQSIDKKSTDMSFYRRKLEDGVAHLGVHLAEELVKSKHDANDILVTPRLSWDFTFKEDTAITARSTDLAELMHRFVVMHCIRDWAAIYAPDAEATAVSMLKEAIDALDEGMYSLELPVKHRREPISVNNEVKIV